MTDETDDINASQRRPPGPKSHFTKKQIEEALMESGGIHTVAAL